METETDWKSYSVSDDIRMSDMELRSAHIAVRRVEQKRNSIMQPFKSSSRDTINDAFRRAVDQYPERAFLDFSGETFTYAELNRAVERLARGLLALNVKPGDRVVTVLDNGPDAVISWFAINRLGAIRVPVNTAYKGEYLRHQIDDAGAKVVIFEAEYIPFLLAIRGELPKLEHILYRGELATDEKGLSHIDRHRLELGELPVVTVAPSDLTMLLYTSGTTGLSKGCAVSHNFISDLSSRVAVMSNAKPDVVSWTPLPLFHIFAIAIVVSTMQIGGRASLARKFSVSGFWPEIQRSKAGAVSLLGSMAVMIANAEDSQASKACFGQVRSLLASPCPASLQKTWRERFGVNRAGSAGYGQTEASAIITCPQDRDVPDGSSGSLNGTFDVRIFDENDEELPAGEIGEIVVRPLKPDVMFSGYWNRVDSSFALATNYWHHTGDYGKFDESGYFYFVDRKKDYLRRRGENISSFEVEQTLSKHPAIGEVAVHAVPSDVTEDDIKATIVLRPEAILSESELHTWSQERIPKFALPRYIEFREELPKNQVGRVLKYQLREEGVTPSTWDREKKVLEAAIQKS